MEMRWKWKLIYNNKTFKALAVFSLYFSSLLKIYFHLICFSAALSLECSRHILSQYYVCDDSFVSTQCVVRTFYV